MEKNQLKLKKQNYCFHPFNKIGVNDFSIVSNKVTKKVTNKIEEKILENMRDNPYITISQLMLKTGLSEPGIKKNIKQLKDKSLIKLVVSKKDGYWEII